MSEERHGLPKLDHFGEAAGIGPPARNTKAPLQGTERKPKGRNERRRQRCWYCDERHAFGEQVCPMERREPQRWKEMTKSLRAVKSEWHGKKIVWSD